MTNVRSGISYLLISASCLLWACDDDPAMLAETVSHVQLAPMYATTTAAYDGDLADAALRYMLERRALLGLSEHTDFDLGRVHTRHGLSHVRLYQTHRGVRVWGADVVVHATSDQITSMNGNLVTGLGAFDGEPIFDDADALSLARADYASMAGGLPVQGYKRESVELVVYRHQGQPHLAWHVHFFTERQPDMEPGRWNYFIDVDSGETLGAFNWLTTLPSQGSGPGGNPNITRMWIDSLDVAPFGLEYMMDTSADVDLNQPDVHNMVTENWKMNTNPGQASVVIGPLSFIGDAETADAHGFTEVTLDMMRDWPGFDSIDDQGYQIKSRVHYDFMFENAFWDGVQMTYGDGATYFYPLTGDIDVIAHEINHGFTERHSDLIYADESGGLNESFSDVAGVAAEHYHEGTNADWDIGHDIARPGQLPGDALRFMCDPTRDGRSVDTYDDYQPGMDVHYSSGIANRAFCLAARRLSDPGSFDPGTPPTIEGVRLATQIWYEANASYWNQGTTFRQGCQGTADAARNALDLGEDVTLAVADSWADVAVYCDGQIPPLRCDTLHTEDSGMIQSANYPANYPDNHSYTDCIYPSSGNTPTLRFLDFATEQGFDFVTISDGSTGLEFSRTSGNTSPPPTTADIIVVKFASDQSVNTRGWRAEWTSAGNNTAPSASFSYEPAGLTALFTDTSTDNEGTVAAWAWEFGDGNTSDEQNPSHTYLIEGTYSVTLTATDNEGGWNSVTQDVTVVEPTGVPTASFEFTVQGRTLEVTDTSTHSDGSIQTWSWDFGDGGTSSERSPVHEYAMDGDYTVSLTVTDNFGQTDTATQAISIVPGGGESSGGCCDSGGDGAPPWTALIVLVGLLAMRRPMRRRRSALVAS